jgi:hypothetical protein
MFAIMARFTGRIPTINFDEGSSVPLAFILQLTDKLTPSDITHGFCQRVIFDHVLDCQTLYANHLVFVDDACREFVLVVASTVLDTSMHAGNLAPCLFSIVSTFFLFRVPPLSFSQAILITGVKFGIANCFTSGEDHHRFEAQIKTNLRTGQRKRFDLLFHQHRDKVAICAVLGDGDR